MSQEYRLQQMETAYLGDLQRRTDIATNERHHHENQIDRQMIETEKEQQDFDMKFADLREKFEHEKQRIGTRFKPIEERIFFSVNRGRRS